jgi:broad specificity phosphatase PhoE
VLPTTISRKIYLIRHGATAWSDTGQHTSTTDLPLEPKGIKQSELLHNRLKGEHFSKVFCSPLKRAAETCRICKYTPVIDPDLVEWNYGQYEGKTLAEIGPNWNLWKEGAPGGESVADVKARANRFLKKIEGIEGTIAVFSSAHILRMIATQWISQQPALGQSFYLSPASISILGYEHSNRVIICWNDIAHLSIV